MLMWSPVGHGVEFHSCLIRELGEQVSTFRRKRRGPPSWKKRFGTSETNPRERGKNNSRERGKNNSFLYLDLISLGLDFSECRFIIFLNNVIQII